MRFKPLTREEPPAERVFSFPMDAVGLWGRESASRRRGLGLGVRHCLRDQTARVSKRGDRMFSIDALPVGALTHGGVSLISSFR